MKRSLLLLLFLLDGVPAKANDWQKYYKSLGATDGLIKSKLPPESVPSTGSVESDVDSMWQRGFEAIGYTYFNTGNSSTADGVRLGKDLQARYVIIQTKLTSTSQANIPLTLPTTETSQTSGTVSTYGSSGSNFGNYSGTTITTGSTTTYIPITINHFDKSALFFMEMPKTGTGIRYRELTPDEMARLETRRAFVVVSVRDGSPAYNADILPGDLVTHIDDQAADADTWRSATRSPAPHKVRVLRRGQVRGLSLVVPPDWLPH